MRVFALAAVCLLTACASTYTPDPRDPVDMAGDLGNRAREYVGLGDVCNTRSPGGLYRQVILETVEAEQAALGPLGGLMERARRGRATPEREAFVSERMLAGGYSAAEYCNEMVVEAQAVISNRAAQIRSLSARPDLMQYARDMERGP